VLNRFDRGWMVLVGVGLGGATRFGWWLVQVVLIEVNTWVGNGCRIENISSLEIF